MVFDSLPQQWRVARFDQILTRTERKVELDDAASYECAGVRWYGQGAFNRETLLGMQIKRKQQWVLRCGDVVYNKLFAWKGAFAIADASVDGCIVSDKFPTYHADPALVDSQFLGYFFRMPQLAQQAMNLSKGAAAISKLTLNPPQFWNLLIPLPSLDEQRRIVARIEALAARIAQARGLRREAMAESETLLGSAFDAEFQQLHTAGFPTSTVGEHEVLITSGPRNFASRYAESGLRFYRAQDIASNGRIADDNIVHIEMPEGMTTRAVVNAGDILVVITGATIGRTAIVGDHDERGLVSQHVGLVRVNNEQVNPRFLHSCILAPAWAGGQINEAKYGQGKPGLNLANLRSLRFPLPPLSVQACTVASLDDVQAHVDALMQTQAETAAELDALLPAVLDQAFRGEL